MSDILNKLREIYDGIPWPNWFKLPFTIVNVIAIPLGIKAAIGVSKKRYKAITNKPKPEDEPKDYIGTVLTKLRPIDELARTAMAGLGMFSLTWLYICTFPVSSGIYYFIDKMYYKEKDEKTITEKGEPDDGSKIN